MITFDRTSYISYGLNVSGYTYNPQGYCFYQDYLIIILGSGNGGKLMAFTIDNDGILTNVSSHSVASSTVGGVYTDGTYIYTFQSGPGTVVYTFNGITFTQIAATSSYFGFGAYQMAFRDDGVIFISEPFGGQFSAVRFNGTSFTLLHPTTEITRINEAGIFYYGDRLFGVYYAGAPTYQWGIKVLTYSESTGFAVVYDSGGLDWLYGWRVQDIDKVLFGNMLFSYDTISETLSLTHTFTGLVTYNNRLYAPYITEDNILGDATQSGPGYWEKGFQYMDASSPYTFHGQYLPTVLTYFYFKFGGYEILLNDERIGSNERFIQAGNFLYAPELNAGFVGNPKTGQRMLTVNFTNLTT